MSGLSALEGLAMEALARAGSVAASHAAYGGYDDLVVLANSCPSMPGEQDDDGVRAIAVIDILRFLVEVYEDNDGGLA